MTYFDDKTVFVIFFAGKVAIRAYRGMTASIAPLKASAGVARAADARGAIAEG